jgi:hypothetical protein
VQQKSSKAEAAACHAKMLDKLLPLGIPTISIKRINKCIQEI